MWAAGSIAGSRWDARTEEPALENSPRLKQMASGIGEHWVTPLEKRRAGVTVRGRRSGRPPHRRHHTANSGATTGLISGQELIKNPGHLPIPSPFTPGLALKSYLTRRQEPVPPPVSACTTMNVEPGRETCLVAPAPCQICKRAPRSPPLCT